MLRSTAAIIILLASSAALAAPLDCCTEPSALECESFRAGDADLTADLEAICKPVVLNSVVTGWPSACALHHECKAGRTEGAEECLLLRLLLTACGESPELPPCTK
jgi:hypothetical protein